MFLDYRSFAGWTYTQVLGDLLGALTGSITAKTGFSASCSQSQTELITTVAGGWSVHDASAGTNAQCLKATVSDDGDNYKVVVLSINATSYLANYESWNATTHIGTRICSSSTTTFPTPTTSSIRVVMQSSARHIVFYVESTATASSTLTGYTTAPAGPFAVFERERLYSWDAVADNHPFGVWVPFGDCMAANVSATAQIPRFPAPPHQNETSDEDYVQTVTVQWCGSIANSFPARGGYRTDTLGQREFVASPLLAFHANRGYVGNLSVKSGVYMAPRNTVLNHAEFQMNGKAYRGLPGYEDQNSSNVGGMCLVPKE